MGGWNEILRRFLQARYTYRVPLRSLGLQSIPTPPSISCINSHIHEWSIEVHRSPLEFRLRVAVERRGTW